MINVSDPNVFYANRVADPAVVESNRNKIIQYLKANNIPLLRIPYWDYDRIEELIEAFILQHTKKKEIKQEMC